jgi:hypothetical protein
VTSSSAPAAAAAVSRNRRRSSGAASATPAGGRRASAWRTTGSLAPRWTRIAPATIQAVQKWVFTKSKRQPYQ